MSPIIARRLGTCIHQISRNTYNHARIFTTTPTCQQTAGDHSREHTERLAFLQSEDLRLLSPVKDAIDKYQVQLDETRKLLISLPTTLKPILDSKHSVVSPEKHYASIAEALGSLDKLKNEKLPSLRAHVEDLEVEGYPEPEYTESEVEFVQRVRSMSPTERKDLLDSLNMEIRAASSRSREIRERFKAGSDEEPQQNKSVERKENPFAKTAAKAPVVGSAGKTKAESKGKGWLSTDEQFANVMADAVPAADVPKKKVGDKANFGMDTQSAESAKSTEAPKPTLESLQARMAQLEAIWRKSRGR